LTPAAQARTKSATGAIAIEKTHQSKHLPGIDSRGAIGLAKVTLLLIGEHALIGFGQVVESKSQHVQEAAAAAESY
jgi:hypothetical protein